MRRSRSGAEISEWPRKDLASHWIWKTVYSVTGAAHCYVRSLSLNHLPLLAISYQLISDRRIGIPRDGHAEKGEQKRRPTREKEMLPTGAEPAKFDGSSYSDRNRGIKGVSIAELDCEIRQRNNQGNSI